MISKAKEQFLIDKLKNKIAELENEPIVRAWIHFKMLPLSTQQSISQAWNDHHARCKESEAGKLFYAQAKAFALGHYGEVKEMAEQARELRLERNFMKAPSIFPFDPEAMEKADEIRSYRMNSAKVKQLEEYGAQSATDL